jgi:hypothetical protein
VTGSFLGERHQVPRRVHHAVHQLLVPPPLVHVARKAREQSPARARVVVDDRGDVDPDATAVPGAGLQVEIINPAGGAVPAARPGLDAPGDRAGAQRVPGLEPVGVVAAEHLLGRIAEQPLRGLVPGADLAVFGD